MNMPLWKDWRISGRLVTIAVVPATLMFIVISFALYFSARDQLRMEIRDRGALLAAALAESSRYAVVSGNTNALDDTLRGLLELDRSVVAIEILDAEHAPLLHVGDTITSLWNLQRFEAPMRTQVADVDLFDRAAGPHVAAPTPGTAAFHQGRPSGYVRVTVSDLPVLAAKRQSIYLGIAVVLITALLSGVAGLFLAQKLRRPLDDIVTALRNIRGGNYDVRLTPTERGELGELQAAIIEMAEALSSARQELENRVAMRTRELQAAIESANAAGEEKQRLIAQGNILIEEERRRIAVEIHDHLNASLVFVQLELQRIASLAGKLGNQDGVAIEEIAERISTTAADLYAAARGIVKQLRPEVIDTLGLQGAVQEMVRSYDAAHPDCRFVLEILPEFPARLPPQLTIAAYRVIQEALSNVVKHSRASHARVKLAPHDQCDICCITIEDDGVGFDAEKRLTAGIGLIGMRERVAAVGGTIFVTSSAGSGTKITIELPRTS